MGTSFCFILTLVLNFYVASASVECGETNLKVNYGQNKTFISPEIGTFPCKYHIKVPRGLRVQLMFREFESGSHFKVYNVEDMQFTWRPDAVIFGVNGPQSARNMVSATSAVGILQKPHSSQLYFTYTAAVPSDGNIGYNSQASLKSKSIRSPGFLTVKLPSGIRSSWNIHAKAGRAIVLVFENLVMASDKDYVEVYENDQLLGRHNGNMSKAEPITHRAFTGRVRVYLHTDSENSYGFKAKYHAFKILTCHKSERMMSQGLTLSDQRTIVRCSEREVCGRMIIQGRTTLLGRDRSVTSLEMGCRPRSTCDAACADVRPSAPIGITVTSCDISCCSTNTCNGSPDDPSILHSVSGDAGFLCHRKSAIRVVGGPTIESADENRCPAGTVCGQYIFEGNSNSFGDGSVSVVSGYAARCTHEADCVEEACNNIPEARNINITQCEVSCCQADMCNRPKQALSPPPPPSGGSVTQCYEILFSRVGNIQAFNKKTPTTCSAVESRCSRDDVIFIDGFGNEVVMTHGECVPQILCGRDKCNTFRTAMTGFKLKSCTSQCCDTDLCNGESPLTTTTPMTRPSVPEGTGIMCYEMLQIEGMVLPGGQKVEKRCDTGASCLRIQAIASHDAFPSIKMATSYGSCSPIGVCSDDCSDIPTSMQQVTIENCDVYCCNTDLCNG